MFRRIFNKKLQDWKIILQNEDARNVHEYLPNRDDNRGKGQTMMVSASEHSMEKDTPMQPRGEPEPDKMA